MNQTTRMPIGANRKATRGFPAVATPVLPLPRRRILKVPIAPKQVGHPARDKLCSAYCRSAARIPTPQTGRFRMSAQPKLMPDVEGLAHQVDPLSRRGFFLTASAAAAAGYTLAAGPVRADAIHTVTTRSSVGEAMLQVSHGELPGDCSQ